MKIYPDTLCGQRIKFIYMDKYSREARERIDRFLSKHPSLGIDTESTGVNCYRRGWQLRTVQIGNARTAIVIPARHYKLIEQVMGYQGDWITHNGHHDIRSIDQHLGWSTGASCPCETHTVAHYHDSRNKKEGGIGHKLKELAVALVDPQANKWETALKGKFKEIRVPTGKLYKSGPKKGTEKTRIITYSEGWELVDPSIPEYIKYAGSDPIITFRLWQKLKAYAENNPVLYARDCQLEQYMDTLHRRAIRLDVAYTTALDNSYTAQAQEHIRLANSYGCQNINSGDQIARVLEGMGVRLTARTASGKWETTDTVLRAMCVTAPPIAGKFIHTVLTAKQLLKRQAAYTRNFLTEKDENDRVHASINILGARTARMSVSNPALQQLPTKDRSDDLDPQD